ncbi:rhodanese-like domain-containing protein [uncultured Tenacibaculum sp.]|uniref:sulfurtransferase n=1 Tax=uncultured Tenacibaculum sp. TaxID=174713 RepID=UPI002609F340|nr:rhodanese-like domain-containing protein [uncultured Tenacibaculum sp.]
MLHVNQPLVTVDWLHKNLDQENLIIFDATIPKVTSKEVTNEQKECISNAIFFDLKGVFLDKEGEFPNTFPKTAYFEEQAQQIGVNQNSCIIIYDQLGVYSSARVWWLFKTFGFNNVAVLNGGLPEWKKNNFPVENNYKQQLSKGNFKAKLQPEKVTFIDQVLSKIIDESFCVADARSKGRFYAETPEPRATVKGGHIPNSYSLPYTELQESGKMKTKEALQEVFKTINPTNKSYIFSCGTGITACILALGLELTGHNNYAVYDGSWTEWGSLPDLPIEK